MSVNLSNSVRGVTEGGSEHVRECCTKLHGRFDQVQSVPGNELYYKLPLCKSTDSPFHMNTHIGFFYREFSVFLRESSLAKASAARWGCRQERTYFDEVRL